MKVLMKFKPSLFVLLGALALAACGPSVDQIATMTATLWTATPTHTPTATATATNTPTPLATQTPTPIGGGSGRLIVATVENLYSIGIDGSNPINITNFPEGTSINSFGNPRGFDLSRDGKSVFFSSDVNRNGVVYQQPSHEIYRINLDGTGLTRLTENIGYDQEPDLSPDGQKIVFSRWGYGGRSIVVADADGQNPVEVLQNSGAQTPYWSPNGDLIAFSSGTSKISTMRGDGTGYRMYDLLPFNTWHWSSSPWSPDGTKLAYTFVVGNSWQADSVVDLHILDVTTGEDKALTQTRAPNNEYFLSWSPDGSQILSANGAILDLHNADGSGQTTIALGVETYQALWSPDGKYLILLSQSFDFAGSSMDGIYITPVDSASPATPKKIKTDLLIHRLVVWLP